MRTRRPSARASLLAIVAASMVATIAAAQQSDPIRLLSRVFTPSETIDAELAEYLQSRPDDSTERIHVILQLQRYPNAAERRKLESLDVRLLDPVPQNAYLAAVPANLGAIQTLVRDLSPFVTFIGLLRADDKSSSHFGDIRSPTIPPYTASKNGVADIFVHFFGDVSVAVQEQLLDAADVVVRERFRSLNGWRVLVPVTRISLIADNDSVKWVQPGPPGPEDDNDGVRSPAGLNSNSLYLTPSSSADDYNLTGDGVIVAQIEATNPSLSHLDYAGRIVVGDTTTPAIPLGFRTHMHNDIDSGSDNIFDVGETVYIDVDDSMTVSAGDWRVPTDGSGSLAVGEVRPTDSEVTTPPTQLVDFYYAPPYSERFVDSSSAPNGYYDPGEAIYRDRDLSWDVSSDMATPDIRLTDVTIGGTTYPAGGEVVECVAGGPVGCSTGEVGSTLEAFPYNPHWHSTHVAGTLIGDGTASNLNWKTDEPCIDMLNSRCNGGTEGLWQGVAPAATIYSIRFKDLDYVLTTGCATNLFQDCAPALRDDYPGIIDFGATISSNSWGWPVDQYCDLYACMGISAGNPAYYDWLAHHYDVLVGGRRSDGNPSGYDRRMLMVTSSGNAGVTGQWRTARINNGAKNTLNVGNVASDTNDLAFNSGRGPMQDGRIKPDVVAPGSQEAPGELVADFGIHSTSRRNQYVSDAGTSMATPGVSGAAALLTQWYRRICDENEPSPDTLKAAIIHGARDLTNVPGAFLSFVGTDFAHGFGLVDAHGAVEVIERHIVATIDDIDDTKHFDFYIGDGTDLKITMVWADLPPSPLAAMDLNHGFLINDLDLKLVYSPGTEQEDTVLPLRPPDSGSNPSTPSSIGEDHRNTVEQVIVENALAGHWQVQVSSSRFPSPPQRFTLIGEFLPASLSSCVPSEASDDIWAKDNITDSGSTPSTGAVWDGEDIWNRFIRMPNFVHQNPVVGRTNSLFLTMRNRGASPAYAVSADIWMGPAGVGLSWPESFSYIGRMHVPSIDSAPATRLAGPLKWTPPPQSESTHIALYARLNSVSDPIPADSESGSVFLNARNSNNIIWRNTHTVSLRYADTMAPVSPDRFSWNGYARFIVRNPLDRLADISLTLTDVPLRREYGGDSAIFIEVDRRLGLRWDPVQMEADGFAPVTIPGTGGAPADRMWWEVKGQTAKISRFRMQPKESVSITLIYGNDKRNPGSERIDIEQTVSGEKNGGVRFILAAPDSRKWQTTSWPVRP